MYGKVFASMYDGTLYGQWQAIITFQQLIVLADAEGYVDMTPPAISARTSIPLDIIETGLRILSEPDPYSRTPDNDGRRIELIDPDRPWGWRLVNHAYYRDLASKADKREKDRVRIAEKRSKSKVSQPVANSREQSRKSPMQKQKQMHTQKNEKKGASALTKPDYLQADVWGDFLAFRKQTKFPLTPSAWKSIDRELRAGIDKLHDPNVMLAEAMAAGWRGFRLDWYENRIRTNAPRGGLGVLE